jgi:hypothetical protein
VRELGAEIAKVINVVARPEDGDFPVRVPQLRLFSMQGDDYLTRAGGINRDFTDPLAVFQVFKVSRVLGSGVYGVALLAETTTGLFPDGEKLKCVIKVQLLEVENNSDASGEIRIQSELTKLFSPSRFGNAACNVTRVYGWMRVKMDFTDTLLLSGVDSQEVAKRLVPIFSRLAWKPYGANGQKANYQVSFI